MTIQEVLITLISIAGGIVGMPLIQWLKITLKIDDDKKLLLLSAVISVVLSVGSLLLGHQIELTDFTLQNFTGAFGIVFSTAYMFFKLLKESNATSLKELFGMKLTKEKRHG